jgi:hypothetical protein
LCCGLEALFEATGGRCDGRGTSRQVASDQTIAIAGERRCVERQIRTIIRH